MKNLEIKWGISRGQYTNGYTLCTLYDGNKKYRTCGGGYDMLGTVFANWLWDKYKDTIIANVEPANSTKENGCFSDCTGYYGFFHRNNQYYLDGACGFSCISAIASKIGLKVNTLRSRNRDITNILIEET